MMIGSTSDYVSQIKRRTNNLETGRKVGRGYTSNDLVYSFLLSLKEREKRRRCVLVQQMTALEEQEVLIV